MNATSEALNTARSEVSEAKMAREGEVEELESRLGRRPNNGNLPKP
ncbi:hypothetical protein [Rhizobium sp. BK176]|nr:hypothetical protein [Rhizobium sp. BK176]MCS4089260.1 hypothetical protein [Rhizobium sp. BK176]